MGIISRDLGPVTAYAAAVNRGYTGTRAEFEELMASYATVAQEAGESASAAADSASDAESSASAAATSASDASSFASAADTSASNASNAATAAGIAQTAAESARNAAQSAQTAAEAAQEGAEAAVEGFGSAVTQAISDVNVAGTNQKELAKRQAEKSEAWAVGQINGEDVGVSDPAYHNNAKYYAESAGTSATTATTKASEAAQSASSAASSAAAAEDAADRAEEAASTFTTDDTLSVKGRAADAKAVGDFRANTFTVTFGKNLYNPEKMLDEKYLQANTGKVANDTGFDTTDFMPVIAGKYLTFSRYATGIYVAYSIPSYAFYTDKTEESFINGSGGTYKTNIVVPENAAYARISFHNGVDDLQVELTDDGTFTEYEPYSITYALKSNIRIPIEQIDGSIADEIEDVTVKGSNLIPVSENGVGAYVRNGNKISFQPSYTTYHYAIIKVKKNTRYFTNFNPMWWILADDNDNVIDGAQYFTPAQRRYIDTGDATKLYYTVGVNNWNIGVIVSEGLTGARNNIRQTSILKPINQLMADGLYACALPKNNIRFTSGISEKFYYKNILSLPENNMVMLGVGGFSTREEDGVTITPTGATQAFNNYGFTVYDNNLSVVEQNVNGQFGNRYADNVSDCSILLIGDSTIERDSGKIGQTLIDAFAERNHAVTLLGTRGSGDNKNEGRSGWSAADYCRTSERGGTVNAFYNPNTEGFDFSYYMNSQNYADVDFVVIQLGINDLYNESLYNAKARIDTLITDIITIITSIKTFNPDQKILLNLPTPCTAKTSGQYAMPTYVQKSIRAKFIYYNAAMLVLSTGFAYVRCSNCHLILDPETDIADLIHPTSAGLEKMGMEVLSQINAWQNA